MGVTHGHRGAGAQPWVKPTGTVKIHMNRVGGERIPAVGATHG